MRDHLHRDDHPATLSLLRALVGERAARGDGPDIGYEATEEGAWIEWETLETGPLSSSEIAVARIAHGCSILERSGGAPPRLRAEVLDAVRSTVGPGAVGRGTR